VVVEFGPTTAYGRRTSAIPAPAGGGDLVMLVAGMKPSTTYHMRARITNSDGSTTLEPDRTFETGAINAANFPVIKTSGNTSAGRGIELLNMPALPGQLPGDRVQSIATDLEGNIIWYYEHNAFEGSVFPAKLLSNGHMLLNISDYGTRSVLREIDLLGRTIREVGKLDLNRRLQRFGIQFTYLHHDMLALPNGHFIIFGEEFRQKKGLTGFDGEVTVEGDNIIELDVRFNPVWTWSTFDHLDLNRHPMLFPSDWTHGNALVLTPDGNLLVSLRHQHWIIKIDYANGTGTGNVLWKLGNEGDFTLTNGTTQDWFFAQHSPDIISTNGTKMTLAVYDNGNNRPNTSGVPCGPGGDPCYGRAAIYTIDEATRTATLDWEFRPGMFAPWGGTAQGLLNGNVNLALPAPINVDGSRVFEVTRSGTPQIVWQMDVSIPLTYRAERIPSLYPGVTW
jgi:arylsulfate sulfotransferase